jgi:gas vesicle protein
MGSGILSSVVAVAGFTGLGVAALYLLDPEQGERRRRALLSAAERATASTEEAVRATVHQAGGSVKSAAHSAEDYAHDLVDRVTDRFSSAADELSSTVSSTRARAKAAVRDHIEAVAGKAKSWLSNTAHRVGSAHDDLADRASDIRSRANEYRNRAAGAADHLAGKHEGHPVVAGTVITAGTVGALAIGAGLAYFLDPAQGRSRREEVMGSVTDWARRVGFSLRQYGRHLAEGDLPFGDRGSSDQSLSNPGESPYHASNGSETSTLQSSEAAL